MKKLKKLFKVFLLIISISFLLILLYRVSSYFTWEREFKENSDGNVLCFSEIESISVDEKIRKFALSRNIVEHMTFSQGEVVSVLKDSISLPGGIVLENICTSINKGRLTLFLKYSLKRVSLPWVALEISKDNRETAEIYLKSMSIGDWILPKVFSKKAIEEINYGISEGIITVNENKFLGRGIQNVEFLEGSIVIKGNLE